MFGRQNKQSQQEQTQLGAQVTLQYNVLISLEFKISKTTHVQ